MTPPDTHSAHAAHEPRACRQCEMMTPEAWRRHWKLERPKRPWHAITDGPDLMARLPRSAHFLTILAYRPGPDGLPAAYQGPLYWEGDADDPAAVLDDMRRCVECLRVAYGLPSAAIRLWLSGGRGAHGTIPPHVLGADAGHPLLPDIYQAMLETLCPRAIAPTFDRGIYNHGKGRMWRLPNRRRTDTGTYKVPITLAELLHKSYPALERLTHRPRKGAFWPAETALDPCPGLVQLYQQVRARVEAEAARALAHRRAGIHAGAAQAGAGLLYHLFQGRGWIDQELSPGKWSVLCPWEAQHTTGQPYDTSTVLFAPHAGEAWGWWHCSHAHCAGRTIHDVLALFSAQELRDARRAAGLPPVADTSGGGKPDADEPPPTHGSGPLVEEQGSGVPVP
jgi:hypothetical protein